MLCDKFESLDPKSKTVFIGELLHSVQSDEVMFDLAQEIINQGRRRGLFDGVVILPPQIPPEINN